MPLDSCQLCRRFCTSHAAAVPCTCLLRCKGCCLSACCVQDHSVCDVVQDYVKWRGPLFHRFLLALVDDSPSVCALAEYLLTDTLASKVCCVLYSA